MSNHSFKQYTECVLHSQTEYTKERSLGENEVGEIITKYKLERAEINHHKILEKSIQDF